MTTREPNAPTTNRRSLLTAGAWAVPTIAIAVAAPAEAASRPCPNISNAASWSAPVNSASLRPGGSAPFFNQYGGTGMAMSTNNANSFLSVQDYESTTTGNATVTISATFTPVAGTLYTFSFRTRAYSLLARGQTMAFTIDNVVVWNAATKTGMGPTRVLPEAETAQSFTWTAPNSTPKTIRVVFTLPNATATQSNDDIRFNLPVITAATCRV